jgi:hypothetical protein
MADETTQAKDKRLPAWEEPVTVSIEMPLVMRGVLTQLGQKNGKPAEQVAYELIERQIGMWVEQARHLNEKIAQGDDSGDSIPADEAFWEGISRELIERRTRRKTLRAAEAADHADEKEVTAA